MKQLLEISGEVEEALRQRRAVVALETTLVAHGFPPGQGAEVGRESERRVREGGAVPATVGVLEGAVRIGLEDAELERFSAAGQDARKVGPRDLAAAAVQEVLGATTVGGTLAACRAAGIGFMATGGIGGVHVGWAGGALDVSADLGELARAEVLVVCSGAKSFLDVPSTAEALETLAVPVLGWRTDELPRFYTAGGGPAVSARVETAREAALVARAHWQLGRRSSLLLARPPDKSLDVDDLIAEALDAAREQGVSGPALTPFVLSFLHERSEGRTLAANRDLVVANAALAAEVAVAYAKLG